MARKRAVVVGEVALVVGLPTLMMIQQLWAPAVSVAVVGVAVLIPSITSRND
jgi:hypothetical protein